MIIYPETLLEASNLLDTTKNTFNLKVKKTTKNKLNEKDFNFPNFQDGQRIVKILKTLNADNGNQAVDLH